MTFKYIAKCYLQALQHGWVCWILLVWGQSGEGFIFWIQKSKQPPEVLVATHGKLEVHIEDLANGPFATGSYCHE